MAIVTLVAAPFSLKINNYNLLNVIHRSGASSLQPFAVTKYTVTILKVK